MIQESQALASFSVRLPVYEGPLDVLLRLIEERELEITAISLAAVADQFIAHMLTMPQPEPQTLAAFVSVAARLLLIKSRALLPLLPSADEEDTADTEALVEQLRAYQAYKHAARFLHMREEARLRAFPVQPPPMPRPVSKTLPLEGVTLETLQRLMQRVVLRWMPPPPADTMIAPLPFTVQESMERITEAVRARLRVTFNEVLGQSCNRIEVVITLLALLELLKRFVVRCHQPEPFGEIIIELFPEEERPPMESANEMEFVE
ncbi:MAG: segregation/condensation protein A [Thermoflexales bacterium]|nr:segregation/condensation protein A [Thermoflexales bacterium]MCX7938529.1 segregation/condensation protein A [Thermoflexales bacterium]MDW8291972.1 ScpA family protein [Anaerolineae bacterium]